MNLLDILFPKNCYGCGENGSYLCDDCLNKIKINNCRICPVCNRPSIDGLTHLLCRKRYNLDGLTSIFEYKGLTKILIKKIKYRFIYEAGRELSEFFVTLLGEDRMFSLICKPGTVLVPVPLHPSRRRWRGFNQSELLGRIIAQKLKIKFIPDLLKRVKKTQPQSFLTKQNRLKNIKNAFIFNQQFKNLIMKQLNFLLFDDVWTTGATLRECGRVLKKNGAKFVWGLTLAA
jgi:ComF family protein